MLPRSDAASRVAAILRFGGFVMRRISVGCLFVVLAVLETGCHQSLYQGMGLQYGCQGCGKRYWGAYVEDPPRPEPCDQCGNWTGKCGCGSFPNTRLERGASFFSMLNRLSYGGRGNCCEGGGCGAGRCGDSDCCAKGGCTEANCGESGCGEAGCGCTHGGGEEMMLEDAPVVPLPSTTSSSRSPKRTVQPVGRTTIVQAAVPRTTAQPACNCGKH